MLVGIGKNGIWEERVGKRRNPDEMESGREGESGIE